MRSLAAIVNGWVSDQTLFDVLVSPPGRRSNMFVISKGERGKRPSGAGEAGDTDSDGKVEDARPETPNSSSRDPSPTPQSPIEEGKTVF
jgi:hypothetical protein